MNAKELIKTHEEAIALLEAIVSLGSRKSMKQESLNHVSSFPQLVKSYRHDIDILDRSIERLKNRYYNFEV